MRFLATAELCRKRWLQGIGAHLLQERQSRNKDRTPLLGDGHRVVHNAEITCNA